MKADILTNNNEDTLKPTLKNCLFPVIHIAKKKKVTGAAGKTFFYLILTEYYFFIGNVTLTIIAA